MNRSVEILYQRRVRLWLSEETVWLIRGGSPVEELRSLPVLLIAVYAVEYPNGETYAAMGSIWKLTA